MVRGDFHPLGKIKAMRCETLYTRIEFESLATRFRRAVHQPVEKHATEAVGAVLLIGHEVVHVAEAPRRETLPDAIACDRSDARFRLKVGQAIALFLLTLDTEHKISLWNVRAELQHHRKAARDVALRFGVSDDGLQLHMCMCMATPNGPSSATAEGCTAHAERRRLEGVSVTHGAVRYNAWLETFYLSAITWAQIKLLCGTL